MNRGWHEAIFCLLSDSLGGSSSILAVFAALRPSLYARAAGGFGSTGT